MPPTDRNQLAFGHPLVPDSSSVTLPEQRSGASFVSALQPKLVDGIFEGGGALGAAFIGALQMLQENNLWFARAAGNSAGAIVAALIAAGYKADELHWLSAPLGTVPPPPTLPANIKQPIGFMDFLDPPMQPQAINQPAQEATFLWKALKGDAFNWFVKRRVKNPKAQSKLIDDFIKSNLAAAPFRGLLEQLLQWVFGGTRKVGDLLDDQADTLSTQFANSTWEAFAGQLPPYLWLVNLLYEGGLCEGTEFLQTIEQLLREQGLPRTGPGDTVAFRDLRMDLAIIAADTSVGEMRVYSKQTAASMSVAEAVRRSMSIPFLFQPRLAEQPNLQPGNVHQPSHEIMDGGLCSNFPYWIFSSAGARFVSDTAADAQRTKLGFLLDSRKGAPPEWGVAPPKWLKNGRPDDPGATKALLATLAANVRLDISKIDVNSPTLQFLERALRVYAARDYKEEFLREQIADALMMGRSYYEINIPLKGYHWLDFSVNSASQQQHFNAMVERGRHTAQATLARAGLLRPRVVGERREP